MIRTSSSTIIAKGRKVAVSRTRGAFALDTSHGRRIAHDSIALTLPVPPSSNNLFASAGHRRVRTAKYAAWAEEAGLLLNRQRPGRVVGPYAVAIKVPANLRGDIDNRQKAILDLLVEYGVTADDKHLQKLTIERCAETTDARVSVFAMGGAA